jgi:hypothetical protein
MEQEVQEFRLISNRIGAVVAVLLTGFLAEGNLRAVFSRAPHKPGWLISLDSPPLPVWANVVLNIVFYIYLVWAGVWFCRRTRGKEQVLVAGFFISALLGLLSPIRALASQNAVVVIRSIQAIGMTVATFAALLILLKSPGFGKSDTKSATRLLLFLGAFALFAFVVGAIMYFVF